MEAHWRLSSILNHLFPIHLLLVTFWSPQTAGLHQLCPDFITLLGHRADIELSSSEPYSLIRRLFLNHKCSHIAPLLTFPMHLNPPCLPCLLFSPASDTTLVLSIITEPWEAPSIHGIWEPQHTVFWGAPAHNVLGVPAHNASGSPSTQCQWP